jgi:hypothetical protein
MNARLPAGRMPIAPPTPQRGGGRLTPRDNIVRAAMAQLLRYRDEGRSGTEQQLLRSLWPDDEVTPVLLRAATAPATLTTSGWASQIAATSLADMLMNLGPASAGSALLRRSLVLSFDRAGIMTVPTPLAAASYVSFVAEGAPIPVEQLTVTGPQLSPRKMAVITSFTNELFEHSIPNVEALVRAVLSESTGLALDAALFDATAGDTTRPAGLRNGVTVTTASALTPATEAMDADLRALAAAVAPVAGNGPIIFVASPAQAVSIRMRRGADLGYEVLASSALAAGRVMAVAPNALAVALDPVPTFDITKEAVLVYDDAAPAQVGTVGSPNTVGAPARSLFQTDSLALKLRFNAAWGLRTTGAVAWTQSVTW